MALSHRVKPTLVTPLIICQSQEAISDANKTCDEQLHLTSMLLVPSYAIRLPQKPGIQLWSKVPHQKNCSIYGFDFLTCTCIASRNCNLICTRVWDEVTVRTQI